MQHLDEGTIHAWLDGALDADEAARVERHTSECAACAAAVAEARGLVAGASRILGALDHTPGGVIPAAPRASLGSATPRRSAWRVLHFTPARAAAAAVLIVAAGTVLVARHAPNGQAVYETAVRGQPMVSHGPPPLPAAADTVATAPELPRPAAPTQAQAAEGRKRESAQAAVKEAAPVPAARFGQLAERRAATRVPMAAPVTAAVPTAPPAAPVADSMLAAKKMSVATAPTANSNVVGASAGAAGFVGGAAPARARAHDANKLSEVTATALMDVAQQPIAALAGCYVVEADSAAGLPQRIVLDSVPAAARGARTSRILDVSGSIAGTWERIGGNGVRLSVDRSAASPFDLHVTSPTTLTGTKTIGNRPVTITINRAADCSGR